MELVISILLRQENSGEPSSFQKRLTPVNSKYSINACGHVYMYKIHLVIIPLIAQQKGNVILFSLSYTLMSTLFIILKQRWTVLWIIYTNRLSSLKKHGVCVKKKSKMLVWIHKLIFIENSYSVSIATMSEHCSCKEKYKLCPCYTV